MSWLPPASAMAPPVAAAAIATTTRSAQTIAPYARSVRAITVGGQQKRGAKMLKNFARNNEWVANAIFRRRHALEVAKWRIVRTDDPLAPVNPAVAKAARQLFTNPNPTRISFRELLGKVLFDLLVLDAGCIEKEFNARGEIVALWPVAGETITIDPRWETHANPNEPRYFQYEGFQLIASLTNDELLYMMHNPSTDSPIGWSPVEATVRIIEAALYGEQYDYEAMKQTAPDVLLDLGPGTTPQELQAFREYYEQEIAGTRTTAIMGGGPEGSEIKAVQLRPTNREQQRMEYKAWLAKIITTIFELDLTDANLIADVNRSTSKTSASKTDRGLLALAECVAGYFTREVVQFIDPNHGFEFADIVSRDEFQQAQIDKIYMSIGVTFPNEIRQREGKDPVEWGDEPYATQTTAPLDNPEHPGEGGGEEPAGGDDDPEDPKDGGGSKAANPFGRGLPARR
jgi:hypothetical protein